MSYLAVKENELLKLKVTFSSLQTHKASKILTSIRLKKYQQKCYNYPIFVSDIRTPNYFPDKPTLFKISKFPLEVKANQSL